jgi:hypothetical protein
MGLRAFASLVLLGGALAGASPGCSRSGDASGGGGQGGAGTSGTTGASGASGTSGGAGAGGGAGAVSSLGGAGGASGGGGRAGASGIGGGAGAAPETGGVGGGAGTGGAAGAGGQILTSDAGATGGEPTDAALDAPVCASGLSCQPVNPCRTGATSCTTGTAQCVETGNQPTGTLCGTGAACVNGLCNTHECDPGACTPINPCHTGTISCTTGAVTCHDTGAAVADGTRCATNKICVSGACVACAISDGNCPSE